MRLALVDRWTLGYVGFATSALAGHGWASTHADSMLLAHALLVAVALAAPRARAAGGAAAFLGDFCPLLVDAALYTEIGLVNTAAGVSHDSLVQGWEEALFGGQPSRDWIRAAPWPWLSWPLHLGYLSYYFILAGGPLALWLSGRRDGARRAILLIMATFYVCYAIFYMFPVAGPRYLFPLARNAATAVAPAVFAQRLLEQGAAWGTAFPSSHVAVALVASAAAWREWRLLGAILLPAAALLSFGTVYGQFHYAVDALAGAVVAALAVVASRDRMGRP